MTAHTTTHVACRHASEGMPAVRGVPLPLAHSFMYQAGYPSVRAASVAEQDSACRTLHTMSQRGSATAGSVHTALSRPIQTTPSHLGYCCGQCANWRFIVIKGSCYARSMRYLSPFPNHSSVLYFPGSPWVHLVICLKSRSSLRSTQSRWLLVCLGSQVCKQRVAHTLATKKSSPYSITD